MCDTAVDDLLLALKFVLYLFITSNVIQKLDDAVFSNYDIVFGDFKSDFFAAFSNDKDFNIVTLDNILILMITILMVLILKLIMLHLWDGAINLDKLKHVKIDKRRVTAGSKSYNESV